MGLYKATVGGLPQASDINQLVDAFNGVHDIGLLTYAPQLSAPTSSSFTLTAQAGTTLGIGAYNYAFTYVTGYYKSDGTLNKTGETTLSSALAITTVSGNTSVKITLPTASLPASAVAFGIYRTAVGGSTYGLISTVKIGNASYTDSTADASRGVAPPTVNNTGVSLRKAVSNTWASYEKVAALDINQANQVGTLKITLPFSWTSTMMNITIRGYDYSSNGAWELMLGGYNWSTNSTWMNTSAALNGAAPFNLVRFGHDGTRCYIYLGVPTTSWQYPYISIDSLDVGFSGVSNNDWSSGWSMGLITTETGTNSATPVINLGLNADTVDGFHMDQDVRKAGNPLFASLLVNGANPTYNFDAGRNNFSKIYWNANNTTDNGMNFVVDGNTSAILTSGGKFTANGAVVTGANANGNTLQVAGASNNAFMEFYPNAIAGGRSAWMGVSNPAYGNNDFTLWSNSNIRIFPLAGTYYMMLSAYSGAYYLSTNIGSSWKFINGEIQARDYADSAYVNIRCQTLYQNSQRKMKTNISDYADGALAKVVDTKVHTFNYVSELGEYLAGETDTPPPLNVGLILDEAPTDIVQGDAISLYSTVSVLWKALQEEHAYAVQVETKVETLEKTVADLTTLVNALNAQLNLLPAPTPTPTTTT